MNIKVIRRISQIFFFILIIYGGFLIATAFNISVPPPPRGTEDEINLLDTTLPFRACRYIEPKPTLFESCSLRYLLDLPINRPPLILIIGSLFIILVVYIFFARFLCGWFCPLGFTSDMFNYVRQKLKLNRISLSDKLKNILRLWRYSFLLFLVFLSLALISPLAYGIFMDKNFYAVACQVCPARTILPILGGKLPTMPSFITTFTSIFSTISLAFLAIFLSGLFITRAWCRICPNGSFTSLFNKGSLIVKEKDVRKCTKCGVCKRVCPFENTHVYEEKNKKVINHPNCVMCLNCIDNCPEKDCLKVKVFGKTIFSSKFRKK